MPSTKPHWSSKVQQIAQPLLQGCEADVVIFSCVRASSGGVGFLEDVRRMNVGLTRARCSVFPPQRFPEASHDVTWLEATCRATLRVWYWGAIEGGCT